MAAGRGDQAAGTESLQPTPLRRSNRPAALASAVVKYKARARTEEDL